MKASCVVCGKDVQIGFVKTCGDECSKKHKKEANTRYYAAHPEKRREANARYYAAHKVKA